jgi:hypothetical protein
MPQLVGSTCLLCQGRIGSSLDGDYCANCGRASHFECRRAAVEEGKCAVCGAPFDSQASKRRAEELKAAARAAMPRPLNIWKRIGQIRRLWRLTGFLVPAVMLLALGVFLVASPELRDDPRQITGGDVVRGIAMCLVGAAIALYGFWNFRAACRKPSEDEARLKLVHASEFQRSSRRPDDQPWTSGRQGDGDR